MEIISCASNVVKGDGVVTPTKIHDAVYSKADRIELDVNLTKDEQFVCYRDAKVDKVPVMCYTFKELRELVPDLMNIDEAINEVDGRKKLMLDVQNYGLENVKLALLLKRKVLDKYSDDIAIMSDDLNLLNNIIMSDYENETYAKVGLFTNPKSIYNDQNFGRLTGIVLPSEAFTLPTYKVYADHLSDYQKLFAIDKSSKSDYERFINASCDGIISDDVYKLERTFK